MTSSPRSTFWKILLLSLAVTNGSGLIYQNAFAESADLTQATVRCRVTSMTPDVPVRVMWRYGGEGQGGEVISGEFTRLQRKVPSAPRDLPVADAPKKLLLGEDLLDDLNKKTEVAPSTQIKVEGQAFEFVFLKLNTWSPPLSLAQMATGRRRPPVFTITLTPYGKIAADELRNVTMEFELSYQGKVLKRFTETGPEGATVGIALGLRALKSGVSIIDADFLDEVCGLAEYSSRRASELEKLPWASRPTPQKYAIVTDCSGLGTGTGYGVRTTNLKVMENEFRTLRQFGVNGLRGAPVSVIQMANRHEGFAQHFTRAIITGSMGYPVPSADRDEKTGEITSVPPGAGDPFVPGVLDRARPQINATVDRLLTYRGFDEVWGLTQDEIGCVFDRAAEKKNIAYVSPHCIAAFRNYLKSNGLTPADCGAKSWDEVDPWTSTAPRPLTWTQIAAQKKEALFKKTLGFQVRIPGEGEPTNENSDVLDDLGHAQQPKAASETGTLVASRLPPRAEGLIKYYNSRFVNYASATAFTPLKDAIASANEKKLAAIERGDTSSPVAKQPIVLSYALRGQTFIRRHSLDFFEFYRHADNAFVYETSHTDRTTQIFDSYICDVGRMVSEKMDKRFGIYVKPHRGSGNQRALSFVARGGTMLYWYTYGPAWFKGDSFSENPELLHNVSRFARILGRAEDTLYGARWEQRPEVAIVKPRTTTLQGGRIDNALWHYMALAHAHIPVDPLDEAMLETEDLSHYKVIYIGGEFIRRASAEKLSAWVQAGGTLYTSDQGMMWDEARQPLLDVVGKVFGISARGPWQTWDKKNPAPESAAVVGQGVFVGGFTPTAREVLHLSTGESLVQFADHTPAVVRNRYGSGTAYLVAFPAGTEYGRQVGSHTAALPLDMEKNATPARRHYVVAPALERIRPPVTASRANVETVLVKHPNTGRRAIPLMNWAYQRNAEGRTRLNEFRNVVVTIENGNDITKVVSAWLDKELPLQREGNRLLVTLPELADCDVLLLE